MMTIDTRRRIDSARDVLVGKVPDPKAQVEQITTALIYKFMDDMDKESEELGGKARFFVNEYEKYAWSKLLDPRLGGFDRLTLYSEALLKMPQNPNLPQLFRNILKDAFLPYRDPETLNLFLKEINGFTYDHSEKLGDAYEYLLSVLGSQGDAGQFRTPRHIIDFIVEVVDPKKDETVLDPACGTAGFLISAYKHILKQNTIHRLGDQLTPDEKTKLMNHFIGYDISPDMVKLSLVNMYLHSFPNPNVFEYDTLTNEERWDETYDVIMANPPFMSPKGGIRPHKRFSIQANRSEVLFVDYIAEHLNIHGRAGVIVPEGIIFQSGTAYKALRKMLVEKYLFAVVSLPSGVFQPYSGVKTSILLMDKQLAKKAESILFVKVENDGFDLGAQRRAIEKNDLTEALCILQKYKQALNENTNVQDMFLDEEENMLATVIGKGKIAKNGDYNLSGERYRENLIRIQQKYPMVELEEIAEVFNGKTFPKEMYQDKGKLKTIKVKDYDENGIYFDKDEKGWLDQDNELETNKLLQKGDTLIINAAHSASHVGRKIGYCNVVPPVKSLVSGEIMILRPKNGQILPSLLNCIAKSDPFRAQLKDLVKGIHLYPKDVIFTKIPLPPLEIQQEIVAELESYQKIIDAAKQIVENYKPSIKIDPSWELVRVNNICDLVRGSSPRPKSDQRYYGGNIPRLMISDITRDGMYTTPTTDFLTQAGAELSRPMKKGEVIMAVSGNPGLPTILKVDACIHDGFVGFRNLNSKVLPEFLYYLFLHYKDMNNSYSIGAVFKNLTTDQIKEFEIPLPPIDIQKQIVSQLHEEQQRVQATKELADIFEQKIKDKIAEVWGEELHEEQGQNASSNGTHKQVQSPQQPEIEQAELDLHIG